MTDRLLEVWEKFSGAPLDEFLNEAPVMLHSVDTNGYLKQVNRFWARKLGYEPEEMIGRKATDFMTESSREYATKVTVPEFKKLGRAENIPYDFVHRNGAIVPVVMNATVMRKPDGSYSHSLVVISEAPTDFKGNRTAQDASDISETRNPLEQIKNLPVPLKVLVAEDNDMNQKVLRAYMHPAPVEATYVWNGQEAIDLLNDQKFDAAIFDIDMPVMDGIDAVRYYRHYEIAHQTPRMPIIACTALSGNDAINRFMHAGFDHYLPKPISIPAFADCLDWVARCVRDQMAAANIDRSSNVKNRG